MRVFHALNYERLSACAAEGWPELSKESRPRRNIGWGNAFPAHSAGFAVLTCAEAASTFRCLGGRGMPAATDGLTTSSAPGCSLLSHRGLRRALRLEPARRMPIAGLIEETVRPQLLRGNFL